MQDSDYSSKKLYEIVGILKKLPICAKKKKIQYFVNKIFFIIIKKKIERKEVE